MNKIYGACAWCETQAKPPGWKRWTTVTEEARASWERHGYVASHGICPMCAEAMRAEKRERGQAGADVGCAAAGRRENPCTRGH